MTGLFQSLFSLLPALNWRRVVARHGVPLVAAGVLLYEVAIPLRDELLLTSRDTRATLKAQTEALTTLARAKESDSIHLAELTLLYKAREYGQAGVSAEELTRTHSTPFPRER